MISGYPEEWEKPSSWKRRCPRSWEEKENARRRQNVRSDKRQLRVTRARCNLSLHVDRAPHHRFSSHCSPDVGIMISFGTVCRLWHPPLFFYIVSLLVLRAGERDSHGRSGSDACDAGLQHTLTAIVGVKDGFWEFLNVRGQGDVTFPRKRGSRPFSH